MNKSLLVDGNSLLVRCCYAVSRGAPGLVTVTAVDLTLGAIHRACDDHGGRLVLCWDDQLHGPAARRRLYPDYKANRLDAAHVEMRHAIDPLRDLLVRILGAAGVYQACSPSWEADDLIATLAERDAQAGRPAVVVSSDMDLWQLVTPGCAVIRPTGPGEVERIGPDQVRAKLGVRPEQVPDLKALMGDKSDNIRGVPGVGEKRAAQLLATHSTVEAVLAAAAGGTLDCAVPSVRARFQDEVVRAQVRLAKQLATLNRAAPIQGISRPADRDPAVARELAKAAGLGGSLKLEQLLEETEPAGADLGRRSA